MHDSTCTSKSTRHIQWHSACVRVISIQMNHVGIYLFFWTAVEFSILIGRNKFWLKARSHVHVPGFS